MSDLNKVLTIRPPGYSTETLTSRGHECPKCNGRGYRPGQKTYHNQYTEPEDCETCQGTGKLKGLITIEWAPDNKE